MYWTVENISSLVSVAFSKMSFEYQFMEQKTCLYVQELGFQKKKMKLSETFFDRTFVIHRTNFTYIFHLQIAAR